MDLDLDPRWVMWKALVLEVMWVPSEVVAPSEVSKTCPPSELLLVCWGYSEPENFYSKSVVAVATRVKFVGVVEMCFYEICGKSDLSYFLLHHHTTRKEVYLGGSS